MESDGKQVEFESIISVSKIAISSHVSKMKEEEIPTQEFQLHELDTLSKPIREINKSSGFADMVAYTFPIIKAEISTTFA